VTGSLKLFIHRLLIIRQGGEQANNRWTWRANKTRAGGRRGFCLSLALAAGGGRRLFFRLCGGRRQDERRATPRTSRRLGVFKEHGRRAQ